MESTMKAHREGYKWKLLSSVSAVALINCVCIAAEATTDAQPTLWLELGYQFEGVDGRPDAYLSPFSASFPDVGAALPTRTERALSYSKCGEGAITFQPRGTDWTVSASIQYGRAHGRKHDHQQPDRPPLTFHTTGAYGGIYPPSNPRVIVPKAARFADARSENTESHLVIDFQAGKDVGLGMLGNHSKTVLSAGLRFAQFTSGSRTNLALDPDFEFYSYIYDVRFHASRPRAQQWDDYRGASRNEMSFSGVGPSISLTGAVPFAGSREDGEVVLDWGANASVLFGRQKTRGEHEESARHHALYTSELLYSTAVANARARSVAVPNIGGFASVSLQWTNAKLSLGYRGDFFFRAIDAGIDARHEVTQGFHGPFASISFGVSPSDL